MILEKKRKEEMAGPSGISGAEMGMAVGPQTAEVS
jgi:hypothetical protein